MGRRQRDAGIDGFAVVDKPGGMTSHDVVAAVRKRLGTGRVGHAGTLDPSATGVLVIGVGRGTRLLRFIVEGRKAYEADIRFGATTTTLDADGEVVATYPLPPESDAVIAAAAGMVGESLQAAPMVSARRVGGVRLHELARQGIEVEREARPIRVDRFDVAPTDDPSLYSATIDCSAGTYVRVLAADLAEAVGSGAHLSGLRRTRVDPFTLESARPLDDIDLLPLAAGVSHLATCVIDGPLVDRVLVGAPLRRDELGIDEGSGPWVVQRDAEVLAVYEPHGDGVKPAVVVARTDSARDADGR